MIAGILVNTRGEMSADYSQIQIARNILANALSGSYFVEIDSMGEDPGYDFELVHPPNRFAVRVLWTGAPRIEDVLGRLAVAVLRFKITEIPPQTHPMIVVVVPGWGTKTIEAVRLFMELHAHGMAWAIVNTTQGALHLEDDRESRGKSVHVWYPEESIRQAVRSSPRSSSRLFTDLNSWLLKVLLLRNVPEPHWMGPRIHVTNPTHLAQVAGVSVQTAYNFVRTFSDYGYIRMSRRDGLHITQNRALLNLWFASAREAAPVGSFACSMFGDPVDLQQIAPVNSNGVVLGGFEASRAHGLLHTIPGTPPSIHVLGNPMSMMKKGDFQFCDQGNAQLLIVDTKLKESVFRGAVDIDGLRVVDALQAALDVAPLPNRGIEQAEVIAERILQWRT